MIGRLGDRALLRYANDVDLARALSLLDQLNEGILQQQEDIEQNDKEDDKSEADSNGGNQGFLKAIGRFHSALKRSGYAGGKSKLRLLYCCFIHCFSFLNLIHFMYLVSLSRFTSFF